MSDEHLSRVRFGKSFILGQYVQHIKISKNLIRLIQTDPYAFYLKDKLFAIFERFGVENDEPPSRMHQIMKYGFPGLDNIRVFSDYILSYDRRNRVPHWVMEHLTELCVSNRFGVSRKFSEFRSDTMIHSLFRSHNYDYFRSGFDRGHLAAAGNHKCNQFGYNETFFLSNIAPQVGFGFNKDAWNNLEIYVRGLTNFFPDVYVCTGSAYLPKPGTMHVEYLIVGGSLVAVPTHFFKIVVCKTFGDRFVQEAYILPNENIPDTTDLKSFRREVEEIESLVGLRFFEKIERNQIASINDRSL